MITEERRNLAALLLAVKYNLEEDQAKAVITHGYKAVQDALDAFMNELETAEDSKVRLVATVIGAEFLIKKLVDGIKAVEDIAKEVKA